MRQFISQRMELARAYADGIGKTAVIYPAAFVMSFCLVQISLGLIFVAQDLHHASPGAIGWLAGMWAPAYMFGCLLMRPYLKYLLPRYQIVLSMLALSVIMIGMQMAQTLRTLYILQALHGLVLSLFWPSLMGWLSTGSEGPALGRVMARFNLSWSLGTIIAPYACGQLSVVNPRLPIAMGAGILLLTCAYVTGALAALPGVRRDMLSEPAEPEALPTGDRSTFLRFPAWVGMFGTYFGFGALVGILPVGARESLGLTPPQIGLVFLVRSVTNALAFLAMGRTSAWHFRMKPMLAGQTLAVVAFGGLIVSHSFVAILAWSALFGLTCGITYSISIFHGASGSLDRSRRMAMHESLVGTGMLTGPAAGGFLYQAWGLPGVYGACIAILVVTMTIQAMLYGTWRRRG